MFLEFIWPLLFVLFKNYHCINRNLLKKNHIGTTIGKIENFLVVICEYIFFSHFCWEALAKIIVLAQFKGEERGEGRRGEGRQRGKEGTEKGERRGLRRGGQGRGAERNKYLAFV